MLLIDKMLVGGIRFVIDKLMVAVDQELDDDTSLREQLLAAQLSVELGEMTQEEFAALEDAVLARIREIRERRGEVSGPIEFGGGSPGQQTIDASEISGIEADFVADEVHGSFEPQPAPAKKTKSTPPRRRNRRRAR